MGGRDGGVSPVLNIPLTAGDDIGEIFGGAPPCPYNFLIRISLNFCLTSEPLSSRGSTDSASSRSMNRLFFAGPTG